MNDAISPPDFAALEERIVTELRAALPALAERVRGVRRETAACALGAHRCTLGA
jgi:hypothetical protein